MTSLRRPNRVSPGGPRRRRLTGGLGHLLGSRDGIRRGPRHGPRHGRSVTLALVIAYASWESGVRPFTALSYGAIGGACLVVLACYAVVAWRASPGHTRRLAGDQVEHHEAPAFWPWRRALAWAALGVAGIALEIVGLALGGRSKVVPTLSTVVDQLAATRGARLAAIGAWLGLGIVAAARMARLSPARGRGRMSRRTAPPDALGAAPPKP